MLPAARPKSLPIVDFTASLRGRDFTFRCMASLPQVNTKHPDDVLRFINARLHALFPSLNFPRLQRVFGEVHGMFEGRHSDYLPIDLKYHDLEHTLQATVCMMELFVGRAAIHAEPALTPAQVECGLVAALLHDCGYLKLRSDRAGTGAKYTFCHVLRSCAFASSYLPPLGFDADEVSIVVGAITCTGPVQERSQPWLQTPTERMIGFALATADYLGQMAADDYPDELDSLYHEFRESEDFCHVPESQRAFTSADDLKRKTPEFWGGTVLPKLEGPFGGLHRFLAVPPLEGPNPYLEAIERNLIEVRRRLGDASSPHQG